MRIYRIGGYTLTELLIVLSIISIFTATALPTYRHLMERTQKERTSQQLMALLAFARSSSIRLGKTVTYCASFDNKKCNKNSNGTLLVFTDYNGNNEADDGELLSRESLENKNASLQLVVSGGRHFLRFRPDGTAVESGSIISCPINGDDTLAVYLVINFGGRVRPGVDQNNDGIPETASGQPLACGASFN